MEPYLQSPLSLHSVVPREAQGQLHLNTDSHTRILRYAHLLSYDEPLLRNSGSSI